MSTLIADAVVARFTTADGQDVIVEAFDAYDETEIHAHCQSCDRPVGFCGYGPSTRFTFTGALKAVSGLAKRHAKTCGTKQVATS